MSLRSTIAAPLIGLVIAVTVITAAFAAVGSTPAHAQSGTCSLQVSNQTVAAGTDYITVDSAMQPLDGYIVVHAANAEGGIAGVIGSAPIAGGETHTAVKVTIDHALADGEIVWPMLHTEDNDNGVYDDAATDAPLVDADCGNSATGNVVTFPLTVSIEVAAGQCTLTVADQTVSMGSSTIIVATALQQQDGYIVVHESDSEGGIAGVIGSVAISGGVTNTNVSVTLDRELVDGEKVWPMLHTEDNANGVYDDAATDKPTVDETCGNPATGNVVTFPLTVTVAAPGPPATGSGLAATSSGGSGTLPFYLVAAVLIALGGGTLAVARRR